MNFLNDLFNGGGDEILFFIIVFLFLLNQNRSEQASQNRSEANYNDFYLFFIILFGLLFLGKDCSF